MVSARTNTRAPVGAPTGPNAKRRGGMGGKLRADRDGDVKMDAGVKSGAGIKKSGSGKNGGRPAGSGKGSGRLAARLAGSAAEREVLRQHASSRSPPTQSRKLVELKVTGWEKNKASNSQDHGQRSLEQWLEKKASTKLGSRARSVKIKKSRMEDDYVLIISIPSDDYGSMIRLNGYQWAGINVSIKKHGVQDGEPEVSAKTQDLKDKLRHVLEARYNGETKLLDMSAIGQDPILQATNIFDSKSTTEKLFPALMKVLEASFEKKEEMYTAINSVSLANCDLSDLKVVNHLSVTLPQLQNLDLSNNKLETIEALAHWRQRFRQLQHLVITGNPLEQKDPDYVATIMKWWPTLRMLNGIQIRTEDDVVNQNRTALPFPIRSAAFQDESGIAEAFVRNFFAGFDTDRAGLAAMYYDEQSDFSYSVNAKAPQDPTTEGQARPPWSDYLKDSRNLKKITQLPARNKRHFRGTASVADAWAHFPGTKHPDLAAEARKWLIEAHSQPGVPSPDGQAVDGLLITVHGEFEEVDKTSGQLANKKRSFDRTFILGPGASGVRVVNDMLTIRCFGGTDAFEPEEIIGHEGQPRGASPPAVELGLPSHITIEAAEYLCSQLSMHTNMTLQSSKDCLSQCEWELQRALEAFESVKSQLPAEAFMQAA